MSTLQLPFRKLGSRVWGPGARSWRQIQTSIVGRTADLGSDSDGGKVVDFSGAVEDFKNNGVAILPVKVDADWLNKSNEIVVDAWKDALERGELIRGHEVKVGKEFGFQEMVQRAPGRYDIHWRINGEKHFLDQEKVLPKFLPFVHQLLGGQEMTSLNFNGCLLSLPGAKEQLWHVDGEHLFTSEPGVQYYGSRKEDFFDTRNTESILPVHCLNIFVPLVDVEKGNGGTQFCLGSHFHTKFFNDEIVWQDTSWKDRIGFNGEILTVKVDAGEVLAFDYRCLHRALEHGGKENRPLLYYTYTKRWFNDSLNFADLPSLKEADGLSSGKSEECEVMQWRSQFPALSSTSSEESKKPSTSSEESEKPSTSFEESKKPIYCDGAAGSQVPQIVIDRMTDHLTKVGSTNVGGQYSTAMAAQNVVRQAREAGKVLLAPHAGGSVDIAFGLNCSNLMFHLARTMENSKLMPGDNVVLSRACHDANIAPWLILARNRQLEVRWIETLGDRKKVGDTNNVDDSNMDKIDLEKIADLVDSRTRLISLGLASNATGRLHLAAVNKVKSKISELSVEVAPYLVLDGTHYVPHRRSDLGQLGADVIVCSAYKFFGPHLGVMAYNKERLAELQPSKVGLRFDHANGNKVTDLLDCGLSPTEENCQISRWEMGTLNYEGLAGFEACVDYLASLSSSEGSFEKKLNDSFKRIKLHEESISRRFLEGISHLLANKKISLIGTKDPSARTPTFALCLNNEEGLRDPYHLANTLSRQGIYCTHGNHYAPDLVEGSLNRVQGVTRLSFMHYNTITEVDRVIEALTKICD